MLNNRFHHTSGLFASLMEALFDPSNQSLSSSLCCIIGKNMNICWDGNPPYYDSHTPVWVRFEGEHQNRFNCFLAKHSLPFSVPLELLIQWEGNVRFCTIGVTDATNIVQIEQSLSRTADRLCDIIFLFGAVRTPCSLGLQTPLWFINGRLVSPNLPIIDEAHNRPYTQSHPLHLRTERFSDGIVFTINDVRHTLRVPNAWPAPQNTNLYVFVETRSKNSAAIPIDCLPVQVRPSDLFPVCGLCGKDA